MKLLALTKNRWLLAAIRVLVAAVVVGFAYRTLWAAGSDLRKYPWHLRTDWLVLAGVLCLLGYLPAGLFWHRLLRGMGQDARLGETLRAYYIGQLGKYVPGKVMVIVIRTALIRSRRVDTGVAVASVFFETLTMMAVGGFLSAVVLVAASHGRMERVALGVLFLLVTGVPTFPPLFKRLARLAGVGRSDPQTVARLNQLSFATLAWGWVAMSVGWIVSGLGLWAVLRAMDVQGLDPLVQLPALTAAAALAKVAGFLSFIPAGLGVADCTLTGLVAERLNELAVPGAAGVALVAAVLSRLVALLCELVISAVLYFVGPRPRPLLAGDAIPESDAGDSPCSRS